MKESHARRNVSRDEQAAAPRKVDGGIEERGAEVAAVHKLRDEKSLAALELTCPEEEYEAAVPAYERVIQLDPRGPAAYVY